jgi:hypothetical protein
MLRPLRHRLLDEPQTCSVSKPEDPTRGLRLAAAPLSLAEGIDLLEHLVDRPAVVFHERVGSLTRQHLAIPVG